MLKSMPQGKNRDDNWGMLKGWIVDPETGKPVNEVFVVDLLKCSEEDPRILIERTRTDNRGYLSIKIRPYTYCLRFFPDSRTSKYSFEPYPFINADYYIPAVIEKGKITEFRKKATIAGRLKIRLLDTKGRVINPKLEFEKNSRISIRIESQNLELPKEAGNLSNDDISDGEMIVHTLYPDTYTITVVFFGLGFPSIEIENIVIKATETTEVDIIVDPADITGIEGKIVDKNGLIIKHAEVFLTPTFPVSGEFNTYTDRNGFYRLTGLPEGIFEINVSISKVGKVTIFRPGAVEIKKNMLIRKDITLDWSSNKKK
jgi:hypothetical protein